MELNVDLVSVLVHFDAACPIAEVCPRLVLAESHFEETMCLGVCHSVPSNINSITIGFGGGGFNRFASAAAARRSWLAINLRRFFSRLVISGLHL